MLFSAAFLFSVLRSRNILHNIATTRSHHQAKSTRSLPLPSMSSKNLSDVGLHPAFCQSSKIHAATILKSTALDSSLFPNAASHFIIRRWSTSRSFHLLDSEDNSEETLYFIYEILWWLCLKPLQSFFVFHFNLMQL